MDEIAATMTTQSPPTTVQTFEHIEVPPTEPPTAEPEPEFGQPDENLEDFLNEEVLDQNEKSGEFQGENVEEDTFKVEEPADEPLEPENASEPEPESEEKIEETDSNSEIENLPDIEEQTGSVPEVENGSDTFQIEEPQKIETAEGTDKYV